MTAGALPSRAAEARPLAQSPRVVRLPDVRLTSGDYPEIADWLLAKAQSEGPVIAAHVNLNNYHALRRWDPGAKRLAELELVFDGIGMKLAASALGHGWVGDVNGTDLFPLLLGRAAAQGLRVFFLGASADVVEKAARETERAFPALVLAGAHHGYFPAAASHSVVELVRRARTDLLVVGMGCPRQEEFALAHRAELGAKLIWTAGGIFDFVSGAKPRAPLWLRRLRLEWLFRLALEPGRMWRRNTLPPLWLAWRVIRWRLRGARASE